ncbi:hypothetical protein ETB97_001926 [Aspergillus alliaceus]|uniref:Xylanolytic transcriptional activator regulatory domain-containing protein n=1 Tax=Petromyces alliaceus TaxID=209559 RepID=A0A8H6EAR4_PETAA|nr:hypothetical protein ETB97_001926 [Aspergillus burnettii]
MSLGGLDTSRAPSSNTTEAPRQPRHIAAQTIDVVRSPGYVHQANEVSIIRRELDSNSSLSTSRRHVLESALSLISDFSNLSHLVGGSSYDQGPEDDASADNIVLPELFFMMMNPSSDYSAPWKLHWPDHLSHERLESMCLAVINGKATGQIESQYKVCIFARAVTYMNRWLRVCTSSELAQALESSKKSYIAAALRSIRQLDILHKPSLLMLQSLLSGVNLMQNLGDTTQAWTFTAFASRLLVALGYHSMDFRMLEECDQSHEIRGCIRWCYYFDKALSMLLVRPPSLPALSIEPVSLLQSRPTDPLDLKANILIKLAHVLDGALSLLAPGDGIPDNQALGAIARLEVELQDIWEELCEARAKSSGTLELRLEWDAVDFTYHSIITTVLRLNSISLHDHRLYEAIAQDASQQPVPTMGAVHSHDTEGPVPRGFSISASAQLQGSSTARAHSIDTTQLATSEPQASYSDPEGLGASGEGLYQRPSSLWDDGLMWELFNVQPTIEWFDAGYKDSATGL